MLRLGTFAADVRAAVLTGLSTATATAITAADSVVSALGKLQAQINASVSTPATALPLMNGTATVGTATKYAREDHIHGTDSTRAPVASPTFTTTAYIAQAAVPVLQFNCTGGGTDEKYAQIYSDSGTKSFVCRFINDASTLAANFLVATRSGYASTLVTLTATTINLTGALSGVNFGNVVGSTISDLSKHIRLYSTTYGIGVTGARLNIVAETGSTINNVVGGTDYWTVLAGYCQTNNEIRVLNCPTNGQFRLCNGTSPGAILRNDGAGFYILLSNNTDPYGNYNALRPFTVNVYSGLVTIANGLAAVNLTVSGTCALPTAATAYGGTRITTLTDFPIAANASGFYGTLPGGMIIQGGSANTSPTNPNWFAFPVAFPNACAGFAITGSSGTGYPIVFQTLTNSTYFWAVSMNSTSGASSPCSFSWVAVGW